MKERSRGQIIARGSKKWLVRVYNGRDPVTKKRQYVARTVEGTYKQAASEITKMSHQQDTQTFVQPAKETLSEFFNRWMDTRISLEKIAPKTATDYKDLFKRYIEPAFGMLRLDKVSHGAIQALVTRIAESGHTRTAIYCHQVLSAAMKQAVQWEILLRNPCAGMMLPESKPKIPPILNPEQAVVLLSATTGTPLGTLWMVMLTLGLRPQEALALKWDDFDQKEGTLRIHRAVAQVRPSVWEVAATKTEKSRRVIPLPQHTVDALVAHKRSQAEAILVAGPSYERNGFIFANSRGQHFTPPWLRDNWKRDLKSAKLPVMKPYCARHSHLSHLLMAGVHPKVASERAGHATTKYTMETYTHVLPAVHRETAEMVEGLLWATKKAGGV